MDKDILKRTIEYDIKYRPFRETFLKLDSEFIAKKFLENDPDGSKAMELLRKVSKLKK